MGATYTVPVVEAVAPVLEPPRIDREDFPFVASCDFQGLTVHIENLAGSIRSGVDRNGHEWTTVMAAHYGEIEGTTGADGDPLDAYVGPDAHSPLVVVVHQNKPDTGEYDEDKVMLGYGSVEDALEAYASQYDRPGFYGAHTAMPIGRLIEWCAARAGHGSMVKGSVRYTIGAFRKDAGPYIGPNGGKWADPQHTVHWTPTKHGHQGDWVGHEDADTKAARQKRAEAAFAAWQKADAALAEDRTDRKAYQAAYNALDRFGRALNLDVGDGDEFAMAAARWLRKHGHKVTAAKPKTTIRQPEQGSLFKAWHLPQLMKGRGFSDRYTARLYEILHG